jgi:hypothetical protein
MAELGKMIYCQVVWDGIVINDDKKDIHKYFTVLQ